MDAKPTERSYGKNVVQGKRLLSFFNGCGDEGIRRNGRGKQGKDVVLSEGLSFFCNDCGDREARCNGRGKPAPLQRARGIVQM